MGVKVDLETRQRLKSLGAAKDRSPHYLMRQAIDQYLDREEAIELERQLTMDRWGRFQETGEAVDHDVVAAWMDGLIAGESPRCPVDDD